MALKEISDETFEQEVLKSSQPVLVDFWAAWCGPCKMIAPFLEEIAEEMSEKIKLVKLNVEEHPMTPSQYGVRNIPTLKIFKDGAEVSTQVGGVPKQKIVDWINENI